MSSKFRVLPSSFLNHCQLDGFLATKAFEGRKLRQVLNFPKFLFQLFQSLSGFLKAIEIVVGSWYKYHWQKQHTNVMQTLQIGPFADPLTSFESNIFIFSHDNRMAKGCADDARIHQTFWQLNPPPLDL
jgi:hypothetical protein